MTGPATPTPRQSFVTGLVIEGVFERLPNF